MNSLSGKNVRIVLGMNMIDCAKMIGMTPAVLTRKRNVLGDPAIDLPADDTLRILDRNAASSLRDQDNAGDDRTH